MDLAQMDIRAFQVSHLPLISAFADRLGVVEEIDKRIAGRMKTSPGRIVLALIQDALSGRSPLFRVHELYQEKDTELLLGAEMDDTALGAHTIGRTLDRLYEHGTRLTATFAYLQYGDVACANKILTALTLRAMKLSDVGQTLVHALNGPAA